MDVECQGKQSQENNYNLGSWPGGWSREIKLATKDVIGPVGELEI
jgi:hypothetical protein